MDTDEAALKTKLTAVVAPWKDITGTFSMDFGKATLRPGAEKKLRIRGFWDKVKGVVGDVKDGAKDLVEDVKKGAEDLVDDVKNVGKDMGEVFEEVGDADFTEAVEFDLSGGEEGVRKNIFTEPFTYVSPPVLPFAANKSRPPRLIIDCSNCFVKGKFKLQGRLKVEDFKILDLTLSIAPSGFSATAEVETTVTAAYSPEQLNSITSGSKSLELFNLDGTTTLIEIPVPGAGLVVPKIFSLGMIASVETGFTMAFKGTLDFTLGLTASLPDTARLDLNIIDMEKSTATGFEDATAEPTLTLNNATASIEGTLFFRPKLALKAAVSSVGELSADIKFGLPQISTGAKLVFDAEGTGVCGGGEQEKTGAKFSVAGVVNVVAGVTGEIAGIGGRLIEKSLASHELFKVEKCVPFEIPGLGAQAVVTGSAATETLPGNGTASYAPPAAGTVRRRGGSARVYRPVSIQR